MILPILNFCARDLASAVAVLEASHKLDGQLPTTLWLATDDASLLDQVRPAASRAFRDIQPFLYGAWTGDRSWPQPQNHAWQTVCRHLYGQKAALAKQHPGWLWWEPDATPLRAGWLTKLSAAYREGKQPFAGVPCGDQATPFYLNGVAIYPFDALERLANTPALYIRQQPCEHAAGHAIQRQHTNLSSLLAIEPTLYLKRGAGPTGHRTFTTQEARQLLRTHANALLYRGCSDGTLASIIAGADIKGTPKPVIEQPSTAPLYTISVLCLNHLDLTKQCLASILEHSHNFELIVTDNGSTDGTARYLKQLKRKLGNQLTLIINPTNRGFQEPNEHALTLAKGRYFVLFNNDMVACDGWLEALQAPFQVDPKMAITGIAGTCCAIDSKFQGTGGDDRNPEYIEGGCLMTPTALVRQHGLFSSYLRFIYWEDTDLSLRMRELGYHIATVPIPISHHHRSSTTRHLDLDAVKKHNSAAMWDRWAFYIKRRNFKRRVLVRRRGARGDVLLATPALHALYARWPQADLHVETAHPEMLAGLDWLTTELRTDRAYDHSYDLDMTYEGQPGRPIVEVFASSLGVKLTSHQPIMSASPADLAWARTVARGHQPVLVHAGHTTWPGKNWPVNRFEELVRWLHAQGHYTIAVGAPDSPLAGCHDSVAGEATPQQLYALCQQSRLFVGLDSMPQHVASAANLPSVVLFGATDPACIMRREPWLVSVQASRQDAACVGAHGRRTKSAIDAPCDGACMQAITIEQVQSAISKQLCPN